LLFYRCILRFDKTPVGDIRLAFTKPTFMTIKLGYSFRFSRQLVLSFLLCALLPLPNYAQTTSPTADDRRREAGLPFMRIYTASDYGGSHQVWYIAQMVRKITHDENLAIGSRIQRSSCV
jgi:hypothetical protein